MAPPLQAWQKKAIDFIQGVKPGATFLFSELPSTDRTKAFEFLAASAVVELACAKD